jgi:uncharacterized protein (DUF2141 family)
VSATLYAARAGQIKDASPPQEARVSAREHRRQWNGRILFSWIVIIAVAWLVYTVGITHESIWYDEAYSAAMAGRPLGEIIALTPYDNHPPLYYLLLRTVTLVLGNSEWALRGLSVVGAVALISLGAGPVRRIFGNRTAFIYAAVILATPIILTYAHEARTYTLAIFAVTAGVLYGYLAIHDNRTGDWVCFGLTTLTAAYLHYYGLIAAFFTHLYVAVWLLLRQRERLKAELLPGALVLVAYLPWLIVFVKQTMSAHKAFWLGPVSIMSVVLAFLQPFAYKEFYPNGPPAAGLAFLVSLVLIVSGVVIAKKKRAEKEWSLSLFLLFVYLGVVVTTLIVSLVLAPIFYSRYLLVCVGLFLLLVSLGISQLPAKYLQPAAVGIFALLNIFTIKDIYTQHFNYPMQDLAHSLKPVIQPGDLIITSDSYSMGPAMYYFPAAVHYYSNNTIESQWGDVLKVMIPPLHYEEGLKEILSTHKSFWYITCNTGLSKNIWAILKDETGWEKSQEPLTASSPYSFVAFAAQKYVYTGRVDTQPHGMLTVHVTGLRPVGNLLFMLFDKGPITTDAQPLWTERIAVSGEEMTYSFVHQDYGDYAVVVLHDENKNNIWEIDAAAQVPLEGMSISNGEKVDIASAKGVLSFDELKFSLDEPEKSIEAKMMYPPFK